MVTYSFNDIKEIVIHDIASLTPQDFIDTMGSAKKHGAKLPPYTWVDGVIFLKHAFQETPRILDDRLKGIVHWSYVEYLITDQKTFVTEMDFGGNKLTLTDGSKNQLLAGFVVELRKRDAALNSSV